MGDVVAAGLIAVEKVRANIRNHRVHTFVAVLEHQLNQLRRHLDSLVQLARACDIVLTGDVMKQLPFAMVGDFLDTLKACDQVLCEPSFHEAKLFKVVNRVALHNAKLKLLLPLKPDVSPTSQEPELIAHYLEVELQRSESDTQPIYGALPSVHYVKKAFKGTVLDVTSTVTPDDFIDIVNALLPGQENDMSLEDEYILRARLVEPTSAVSFGLKRLPNLELRIEFRDRINSQVIDLQQVILVPTYVLGPDIEKPRITISEAADKQAQELTVFRIVLNSNECRLEGSQTPGHEDGKIKIAPSGAERGYFRLDASKWNRRDKVNLAIMGVAEVKTMLSDLQVLHMQDMQKHWKLVNQDRAEANGWKKEQNTTMIQ
ncbi:hypothetical protein KCU93_g9096, partial [Aureobasidium melanogenum]